MADESKSQPQPKPQDETITFELIQKVHREEQRSPKLTRIPKGFYPNIDSYLRDKRLLAGSNHKTALEVKNIERRIEDIFNRRERKMFNLALIAARTSIPPENLSEEEKPFFEKIVDSVRQRRETTLDPLLDKQPVQELGLVIFKEDVPAFVGSDMKNYGPFKKGDIAKLPDDNKTVLLKQKKADEFKLSK